MSKKHGNVELKIELPAQTYERLEFLRNNNYFVPMTDNDVIVALINNCYDDLMEVTAELKKER